jgi:hypothetical protein
MVLKLKKTRDRVKTSGLAKKKEKQSYKGHRKTNYKKKKSNASAECSICYEYVAVCLDNSVTCLRTSHTICGPCKIRMKDDNCPMCRSHPVKQPIAQDVKLKIVQKYKKPRNYKFITMSPKVRRNCCRKSRYTDSFGPDTNRIQRQKKNCMGRTNENYFTTHSYHVYHWNEFTREETRWLSEEQVIRYNGSFRIDDTSDSESSSSSTSTSSTSSSSSSTSSTSSGTLSLTDGSSVSTDVGTIQAIVDGWLEDYR